MPSSSAAIRSRLLGVIITLAVVDAATVLLMAWKDDLRWDLICAGVNLAIVVAAVAYASLASSMVDPSAVREGVLRLDSEAATKQALKAAELAAASERRSPAVTQPPASVASPSATEMPPSLDDFPSEQDIDAERRVG